MPRVTPFFPCFKCKYDLRGNVTGQCPECGTRIPKSAQIAIADDLTHLEQQIANDPERELLDPRAAQASA